MPHSKMKEWNMVFPCWVVGFYFWLFLGFFLIYTSKDSAAWNSHCWFAGIELAVCKQSEHRSISRWSASWCPLLQCSNSHFRDWAVCCPFFTFPFQSLGDFIPHLEYAVPPRWFLSAWRDPEPWYFAVVSGGDIYQGSAQLLQLTHAVFIRAPSISNLRHTDV